MKSLFKILSITLLLFTLIFSGCKKDKDTVSKPVTPENEEEVITTFELHFTDSANASNIITATFRDPDGDGGNAYTQFDTIKLQAGKTYYAEVIILNETANPADTISNEVEEEANDHLLVYSVTGTDMNIVITDTDTNSPPLPLGLKSTWRTGSVNTGATRIQLRHQPGVKNGTPSPGENDIDLLFQTTIY